MSGLMSALILFVTAIIAVGLGVISAYGIVNGILFAVAPRSENPSGAGVLVPHQTPVGGD